MDRIRSARAAFTLRESINIRSTTQNTRDSHTRILYLTLVTNCSNTKMGVSNSKVLDELGKVIVSNSKVLDELSKSNNKVLDELTKVNNELTKVNKSISEIKTDLAEVKKIVYRTDNRVALMVEARCRDKVNMIHKKVKGAYDALSLVYTEAKGPGYNFNYDQLVDALYRDCTRTLFARITGEKWIDEKKALASLKRWQRDPNKENNSNGGGGGGGGDDDNDVGNSAQTEADVVKTFIEMLAPFDAVNVNKKQGHKAAKEILKHDETGLALSLIIASMCDEGGCWGWKVLEFDGFSHSDSRPDVIPLLEVKCGAPQKKAKKQLDVRTRFIDAVATLAEYKEENRDYQVCIR
jgi:hypothetical protein